MTKIAEILCLLFCAWAADDLLISWGGTPFLRFGGLTFIIWILPLITYLLLPTTRERKVHTILLAIAVVLAIVGIIGSVNVISHVALALACWAFTPLLLYTIPWLITAVSWMPAVGYIFREFSPSHVVTGRVLLAVLGAVWGIVVIYYGTKEDEKK
jgi:hypothetical protein